MTGVRSTLNTLFAVLVLVWGGAAYLSGRDAVDLARIRTLSEQVGQPANALISALQHERRAALAGPAAAALTTRAATDGAVAALRAGVDAAGWARSATVKSRADALLHDLDGLPGLRASVDDGPDATEQITAGYGRLVDGAFGIYGADWVSRDTPILQETRAFTAVARAGEMLAREDALTAGALADSRLTTAERQSLLTAITVRRFAYTEALAELPTDARLRGGDLIAGPAFTGLRGAEDLLTGATGDGAAPLDQRAWAQVLTPAAAALDTLVNDGIRSGTQRASGEAAWVVVRVGLIGGLGLLAVLVVGALVLLAPRRPASRLGTGAPEQAQRPASEPVPDPMPGSIPQPLPDGPQQPGDPDAPQTDAPQTDARPGSRGSRALSLRLAEHNQALLHRQLTVLGEMERRVTDSDELTALFELDHLATRIRRNVEKLVAMSGRSPGRRWRRPVPVVDAVRAAVAEVEQYARVAVTPIHGAAVLGPALPDLVHLLAELIDNALAAAPGHTIVRVSGEVLSGSCVIAIHDEGPGLTTTAVNDVNRLIQDPDTDLPADGGHGLHVVGRLAQRRSITVAVRSTPHGTATTVVIPPALLVISPTRGARRTNPNTDTVELRIPRPNGGLPHRTAHPPTSGDSWDTDGLRDEYAWYDDDAGPVVGAYLLTGGRTRPSAGGLDLVTMVAATPAGTQAAATLPTEQAKIVELCQQPLSVAETAVSLRLPVGTTRVLLSDLMTAGFVTTCEGTTPAASENLLSALLVGLRAL